MNMRFLMESIWTVEAFLNNELVWAERNIRNRITSEGLEHLLNVGFHGSTQISPWYTVLFDSYYNPSGSETYASPGFSEFTDYSASIRPEFVEAAASGLVITNSANKSTFLCTGVNNIYGCALLGGGSNPSTKGNVAGGGTLFSVARFGGYQTTVDEMVLTLQVNIGAAGAS